MGNWFGNLDLAYKYTVVFVSLLVLTILAGLIKVFFDRRKLKKIVAEQKQDADVKEERMELTGRRDKDEGDFFGIRALEAGFYAGVAQSRPTSRAGSVAGSPYMSTSTLVGGMVSPKDSMNNSVTTLPLAHTRNNSYRDSDTLTAPRSESPVRSRSPPAIRLAPSTAELTGKHRLSVGVDAKLDVPKSPVTTDQWVSSPTFGGSDSGESDGLASPRSQVSNYSPYPPQLPMPQPEGFRASFVSVHEQYNSVAGSMLTASPANPATPTTPGITLNDGDLNSPPQSPVQLLPKTYQPSHYRDDSDGSSIYSERRHSALDSDSRRISTVAPLPTSNDENRKTLLAPGAKNDSRYSEIYDAYYRNSMLPQSRDSMVPDELHFDHKGASPPGVAV